jgi:cadmium resistance protein CadD (predicted permease)
VNWLAGIIVAAMTSFIATNLDDILILTIFYAQVSDTFRPQHIIIGQYLGFTAIILASLPGFFGALILPKTWIGLLGFIPIFIGFTKLLYPATDTAEIQEVTLKFSNQNNSKFTSNFSQIFNPQTYKVAAVTFANGGLSLFATTTPLQLSITLVVFYLLIAVWCSLAYWLTRHSVFTKVLSKYGHSIIPFVLIALGVFIIVENKSYTLLEFIFYPK